MATARMATAVLSLLAGYVIQPIAQPLLPPSLQQYLSIIEPSVQAATIPFRIEYRPTRCNPTVLPRSTTVRAPIDGFEWDWDFTVILSVTGALLVFLLATTAYANHLCSYPSCTKSTALENENLELQSNISTLQSTSNELQSKNSDLEEEVKDLKEVNSELKEEISDLKEEISDLTASSLDLQQEISDLRDDYEENKGFYSSLQESYSALQDVNAHLVEDNETLKTAKQQSDEARDSAETAHNATKDELAKLSEQLREASSAKQQLKDAVSKHSKDQARIDELQRQLKESEAQREQLSSMYDDLEAEQGNLKDLKQKLDKVENDKKQLEDTSKQLVKDRNVETRAKEGAEGKLNTLKQDHNRVLTQISQLQIENKQLEEKSEGLVKDRDAKEQAKDQAAGELAALKKQYTNASSRVLHLENVNMQLDKALEKSNSDLKQERGSESQPDPDLLEQLEVARQKVSRLESEYKQLEQGRNDLFNHLKRANVQVKQLRTEKETISAGFDLLNNDIQSVYQQMEAKSNVMEADIRHLEKENAHLRSLLARACRCKRFGDSSGSSDSGDDENGGDGPGDRPGADEDNGTDADPAARSPSSNNQHDGSMPNGNRVQPEHEARDSQPPSEPNGHDKSTEENNTGSTEQGLRRTKPSDIILGQDENLHSGFSVRDFESCPSPQPQSQQANDPDAEVAAQDPKLADESGGFAPDNTDYPSTQQIANLTPCPLGSAHVGCTTMFIEPPGYATMAKNDARSYQRMFSRKRNRLGCAYAAHTDINPNAPIPPSKWQHSLPTSVKPESELEEESRGLKLTKYVEEPWSLTDRDMVKTV